MSEAEALARHDLVEERPGPAGRRAFALSQAGQAYLRRRAAGAPEDAFAAQHREVVRERREVDGVETSVRLNAAESPLDWLRRRKDRDGEPLVDPAAFEAGERLRRDLTLGQMLPGVTMNWSPAAASRKGAGARPDSAGATETAIAARQRATQALDAVGPDFADLLIDVCGFLKGLEHVEAERGWPARSGKVVLKLALGRLGDHYGLSRAATGPARSAGIRAWRVVEHAP